MAPTTTMWDTSEYIAAAYTFGLPHPPGNPFFVIIGRVFSLLPVAGSVAARINVLAAVCSAVAAGVWFLVAENVLRGWLTERWQRLAGRDARRAHRRDGVHRVEPVRREREGLHGVAHRHRADLVARRALVGTSRGRESRPHAGDDRVSLRVGIRESHGGHAARAGRRARGVDSSSGDACCGGSCCSRVSSPSSSA